MPKEWPLLTSSVPPRIPAGRKRRPPFLREDNELLHYAFLPFFLPVVGSRGADPLPSLSFRSMDDGGPPSSPLLFLSSRRPCRYRLFLSLGCRGGFFFPPFETHQLIYRPSAGKGRRELPPHLWSSLGRTGVLSMRKEGETGLYPLLVPTTGLIQRRVPSPFLFDPFFPPLESRGKEFFPWIRGKRARLFSFPGW